MRSWGYILLIFLPTDPTVTKRFTVFFRWQKILIISNEVLDTKWFRCERTQKAWQAYHLHPVRLHMTTDTNHKFRAHASVTTSQDFHGVQDNWRKTTCLTNVERQNIETTSEFHLGLLYWNKRQSALLGILNLNSFIHSARQRLWEVWKQALPLRKEVNKPPRKKATFLQFVPKNVSFTLVGESLG